MCRGSGIPAYGLTGNSWRRVTSIRIGNEQYPVRLVELIKLPASCAGQFTPSKMVASQFFNLRASAYIPDFL